MNTDNPNMTVDGQEANMVNYHCLFLAFVYNKEDHFGRELVIIYDDWDMYNRLGQREILHLCKILFQDSILDVTL